jgi:hypothetical protein
MVVNNMDLNIWDKVGYETEYKEEGWVLTPYTIEKSGDSFGSGQMLENLEIALTPREVERLTLGVAMADGGDYCADADFWIDMQTFYLTYRDIPQRVDELLRFILEKVAEREEARQENMQEQWMESRVF